MFPRTTKKRICLAAFGRSLEQTQNLDIPTEVIVVNNASTDRTREIALTFPGIHVVDEPRKRLTQARQAGFRASSGDFIANVDADSRLTPGWVATVLAAFAETPSLVALSGPLIYYDLTTQQRSMVHLFYAIAMATYLVNRHILRQGSMVQGGNFVVERRALEAIGGFNLGISFYGEDTDIARRLSAAGIVRFTPKLKMFSSARRLKREGMLQMAFRYSITC